MQANHLSRVHKTSNIFMMYSKLIYSSNAQPKLLHQIIDLYEECLIIALIDNIVLYLPFDEVMCILWDAIAFSLDILCLENHGKENLPHVGHICLHW